MANQIIPPIEAVLEFSEITMTVFIEVESMEGARQSGL